MAWTVASGRQEPEVPVEVDKTRKSAAAAADVAAAAEARWLAGSVWAASRAWQAVGPHEDPKRLPQHSIEAPVRLGRTAGRA